MALQLLPVAPSWSLYAELMADETHSRVSEALISQPVCCAVQIALVDLLEASGVQFGAVVGHSSGEISAAYAAGCLGLEDAMAVAYCRGQVARLAEGSSGEAGGMVAAVMTPAEALSICSASPFVGRICLAASNSPSSVTISGDIDALEELLALLGARGIKARKLLVDKAYHSHHMERCSENYLALLRQRNVQTQDPPSSRSCSWFSSVHPNTNIAEDPVRYQLDGQYWIDNLVNPVQFSQALESTISSSHVPFAVAIEVGPHPALMGPVRQSLESLFAHPLPYTGCLRRAECGIETMSAALGEIWVHAGPDRVDFAGWRSSFGLPPQRELLKGLPPYPWDHHQTFWRESRLSHNLRVRGSSTNSLLGRQHEEFPNGKTWRNILHLDELPWLKGHAFQGQVLFPGAGYVSLAIEAGKKCVEHRPLRLIEVRDVSIPKALVINEAGSELIFKMCAKQPFASTADNGILEAEFEAYVSSDNRVLEQTCAGRVVLHLGQRTPEDVPPSTISRAELVPLSTDRFYDAVSEIGLNYNGVFRAVDSISRTWGHAKATASWSQGDLAHGCTPHPAVLDAAFQTGLGTFLSTAENTMGSSFLPVAIKRAIVDPHQTYGEDVTKTTRVEIEARMTDSPPGAVEVDMEVATNGGFGIQVEGLVLKAIADPPPSEDRNTLPE